MNQDNQAEQFRGIMTPREVAALLNSRGVGATVTPPQEAGGLEGVDVNLDDLLRVLTTLPAEDRLPPELEGLIRQAKDSYLLSRHDTSRHVLFWAGAYLVGLAGDRQAAVSKLWELHARASEEAVN